MITKLLSGLVTTALLILPALGEPMLLWSSKLWFAIALNFAALALQPRFSSRDEKTSDQGTAKVFSALLLPYLVGTILEARFLRLPGAAEWSAFSAAAAIAGISGLAIRTWSIRTLGRFFTLHVQALPEHRVVRDGPYRFARHPSYTGAYLVILCLPALFGAWWTLAATAVLFAAWFRWRIQLEEKVLVAALGPAYEDYRAATRALIPGIW